MDELEAVKSWGRGYELVRAMLSQDELLEMFDQWGTPKAGRELILKARREAPVRVVESKYYSNVITHFASRKMDRMISTESRTVEYPATLNYEFSNEILEYYPQPTELILPVVGRNGKRTSATSHIPDFLLITSSGPRIEEWREEPRLVRLAEQFPGRFHRDEEGQWRFPIAERFLSVRGIEYRLRSANEHPRQYIANLEFLSDYFDPGCSPVSDQVISAIRKEFAESAALRLDDLIHRGRAHPEGLGFSADDVYKAIADKIVAFDLECDGFKDRDRVLVFRDECAMRLHSRVETVGERCKVGTNLISIEPGVRFEYDGQSYVVQYLDKENVVVLGDGKPRELSIHLLRERFDAGKLSILNKPRQSPPLDESLNALPPKAIEEILRRQEIINQSSISPKNLPVSERTLQRYRRAQRLAGISTADQHLALAPKHANKGNRRSRISEELLGFAQAIVKKHYDNAAGIGLEAAYRLFSEACLDAELEPCSRKSFGKLVRKLSTPITREGKRLTYQKQPMIWYLFADQPIHGIRPWQFVHIDFTPVEIRLRIPGSKDVLRTVILGVALDAASRHVVGYNLSFHKPGYRSTMMILRDIVRVHGRLPETIIVDNGPEFRAHAFMRVCQLYGTSIRERPAGKPRFGSLIERFFRTTFQQLIYDMQGNTKLLKHLRMVTKSVHPDRFVEWTLPALHGALGYYFEHLYGTEIHPALNEGPVEYFRRISDETGTRPLRWVRYDETFAIETCPSPKSGDTREVNPLKGIRVEGYWYWHQAFRQPELNGAVVEVRVDPWDARQAFALWKGRWLRCISKLWEDCNDLTEVEMRCYAELLATKVKRPHKITKERLNEWRMVLKPEAFDVRLKAEVESKFLYNELGISSVGGRFGQIDRQLEVPITEAEGPTSDVPLQGAKTVPMKVNGNRTWKDAEAVQRNNDPGRWPRKGNDDDYSPL